MQTQRVQRYGAGLAAIVLAVIGVSDTALGTTSTSQNYQVTETRFGTGSMLHSCSAQYCTQPTIGSMTTTHAQSSSATFSSIDDGEPRLEVIVEEGQSNLGTLTTEHTATKTMKVKISNFLGGGYTLQLVGTPPKFGTHTLATPLSPTAAQPGVEQFAINAVANTTPTIGLDPLQVPADQATFGEVAEAYRTPNLFKYTSEDVIARSQARSGRTDYTISMIVNISNTTPSGHYAGDFAAIVMPAY